MEIIIIILSVFVIALFIKIRMLNRHLIFLSFAERNINKLLIKKNLIKMSEIDSIINESIGDMPEDAGNKLIKYAKSIEIIIPGYMNEEELKKYIEEQELKRKNDKISFTDKMMMEDFDK